MHRQEILSHARFGSYIYYRRVEGPSSCKPLKHNHRTWEVNSALMRLLQRQPLFYFCWSCWSTQKLPTITDPLEALFLFVLFLLHFLAHFCTFLMGIDNHLQPSILVFRLRDHLLSSNKLKCCWACIIFLQVHTNLPSCQADTHTNEHTFICLMEMCLTLQ